MLPDYKGEKLMGKFSKSIKYDGLSIGEGWYNAINDKYLYEVGCPDVTMDKLLVINLFYAT